MSTTTAGLKRRLRALEAKAKDATHVTVLIQPFRNGNVRSITCGAREWLRGADEGVAAFRHRVLSIAHEPIAGGAAVLLERYAEGAASC